MIIKPEKFTPIAFEGMSILDMTDGIDSEISIARIVLMPKSQHHRSMSRQSDKYYYILSGRVDFTLSDNTFNLKAGDMCLVRKGLPYSYVNPCEEPVELLLIHPIKLNAGEELPV